MIRTYTDAPPEYDGFGTRTENPNVGTGLRGAIRSVLTPAEHVEWQRQRYASGMYIHASDLEFALLCGGKFPLVKLTPKGENP